MSTVFNAPRNISNFKAGADLSAAANLNLSVKFDSNGDVVISGTGESSIGIGFLVNSPKLGENAEVATLGGGALGVAATTIAAGDMLKPDATGKLVIASASSDLVVARAMDSAVANDIFEIQPVLFRTQVI